MKLVEVLRHAWRRAVGPYNVIEEPLDRLILLLLAATDDGRGNDFVAGRDLAHDVAARRGLRHPNYHATYQAIRRLELAGLVVVMNTRDQVGRLRRAALTDEGKRAAKAVREREQRYLS